MPARTSSQDQPPAGGARRSGQPRLGRAGRSAAESLAGEEERSQESALPADAEPSEAHDDDREEDVAGGLSFRDAQTALELSLAELQSPDLDVEEMTALYRRASRYADRCEQLLQQVEQEVMQWDPGQPDDEPVPVQP